MSQEYSRNVVYGRMPVLEALKNQSPVEKIYILAGMERDFINEIKAASNGIKLDFVPKEKLNKLTHYNHQGVVAIINHYDYADLESVIQECRTNEEKIFLILLDQITDVRNFGAISRSALLTGCHGVIIPASKSVTVNEDAIKASAGALFSQPVVKVHSISSCLEVLGQYGIKLLVADGSANKMVYELPFGDDICIVLGSEGKGVSKNIIFQADDVFKIPQNDKLDSYNVSVSAGIICYEIYKQRILS